MNIQLSVTLWTIICFVLLMLILRNLLFKPVLRVLDARREKIERAEAKKAEWEKAEREHEALLLEKEAEFRSAQQRHIKDEIEKIRLDSKKTVEAAREDRLRLVNEYRAKTETEHAEIISALSVHTAELAEAFADRLTKE